jgi:hypothetical protein
MAPRRGAGGSSTGALITDVREMGEEEDRGGRSAEPEATEPEADATAGTAETAEAPTTDAAPAAPATDAATESTPTEAAPGTSTDGEVS